MKPIKETIHQIRQQKETANSTSTQTKTTDSPSKQSQSPPTEGVAEGQRGISFQECLTFLEEKGKILFGNHFKIYDEDHPILFKLLVYFIKDTRNANRLDINLHKGILLTGPIGTGKTTLMTLMRYFLPRQSQHIMKSTRDITFEFIQDGFTVINRYSHGSYYWINGTCFPKIYCFDDLGIESNIKYYGNHTNVMAEILLSRYDLFTRQGLCPHATTNLNADELEEIYGNRVRSRMREMFNLISFKKTAKDKRI